MNKNIPPFYVGEPVEAVDAISGSLISGRLLVIFLTFHGIKPEDVLLIENKK